MIRWKSNHSSLHFSLFSFLTDNLVSAVTSFSKFIMQITTRDAAKAYMKMVDNTQFGNSDEVIRYSYEFPFYTPISVKFI